MKKQFADEENCPINMRRFSISQVVRGIQSKTMRYCSHLSDWQKSKRKVIISYKVKFKNLMKLKAYRSYNIVIPFRGAPWRKSCTHAPVDMYEAAATVWFQEQKLRNLNVNP